MATTRVETWRAGGQLVSYPWKTAVAAVAALVSRLRPSRRPARMPKMSSEWLRQHEIDSLKHRDPL